MRDQEDDDTAKFLAVLGHDLRNPLNSIRLGIEVLLQQTQPEATTKRLGRMLNTVDRMAGLISQLIDFSRVRGGPLELIRSEVALDDIVKRVNAAHPERAVQVDATQPVIGHWDAERLQQMIDLLVAHAAGQATAAAPAEVKVSTSGGEAVLEVSAAGEPLSEAERTRMFQPFARSSREANGLGLGLYIMSEIAAAHGGRVDAGSAAGRNTITVTLPIDGAAPATR